MMAPLPARYLTLVRNHDPAHLAGLPGRVAALLDKQILDPAHPQYGGWGDIVDAASPPLAWDGTSLRQVTALAESWGTPEGTGFHDARIAHRLNLAARFYARVLRPTEPFPHNWWYWQIGLPHEIILILLLAGDALEADARLALRSACEYLLAHVWDIHGSANLMSIALNRLGYALATGDAAGLDLARRMIAQSVAPVSDPFRQPQGFRSDGTYFYHGSRVNLGYGITHLHEFAIATHTLAGSPWAVEMHALLPCVNLVLDFAQWTVVGRRVDPFVLDRGLAIPPEPDCGLNVPRRLLDVALLLADARAPRQDELCQAARRLLQAGVAPLQPTTQTLAAGCTGPAAAPLTGARYFDQAEYAVVRRPGWTAAVKMATWRTSAYAGINRLNRKGWHISDGQLILRLSGEEFDASVFPTMDWDRLTGITRADGFRLPHETMGHSWFCAGAVSGDGANACCGLDFAIRRPDDQGELAARKNWFFLDDAIVATGSNIWTTASVAVETVVRHVVLPAAQENETFGTHDGSLEWVAGPDGVYLLPERPRVRVYTEWREGNYGEIGDAKQAHRSYRRRYWTMLIPHGAGPHPCWGNPATDGRYVIVYLPGMSLTEAHAWWAQRPFEILQQDVLAHRLYDRRRDRTLTVRQWKGATVESGRG